MPRLSDPIGHTFGDLTILRPGSPDFHGAPQWICQCRCGRIWSIPEPALKSGELSPCPCHPRSIRSRRKALQWTQRELAERAGTSQYQISAIEGGRIRSGDTKARLLEILEAAEQGNRPPTIPAPPRPRFPLSSSTPWPCRVCQGTGRAAKDPSKPCRECRGSGHFFVQVYCSCGKATTIYRDDEGKYHCDNPTWQYDQERQWYCGIEGHRQSGLNIRKTTTSKPTEP